MRTGRPKGLKDSNTELSHLSYLLMRLPYARQPAKSLPCSQRRMQRTSECYVAWSGRAGASCEPGAPQVVLTAPQVVLALEGSEALESLISRGSPGAGFDCRFSHARHCPVRLGRWGGDHPCTCSARSMRDAHQGTPDGRFERRCVPGRHRASGRYCRHCRAPTCCAPSSQFLRGDVLHVLEGAAVDREEGGRSADPRSQR